MKGQKWILVKHFQGTPKDSDMKLVEFELPEIKDGEILLQAVYLTVDPYMRPYSAQMVKIGDHMIGQQVARVLESKHKDFAKGDHVLASAGWTSHSISDGSSLRKVTFPEKFSLSLALGVLGMPGMTAYFGLIEICNPKPGETVFVSGAAGAVGSAVGQIAKILGCRVVGFAGTDEKVAYLKELGFDEAINYKKITNLNETVKSAAPKGVDVYFDNVGGQFTSVVVQHMNNHGRVAACGAISQYNAENEEATKVPSILPSVIGKRLKVEGFVIFEYEDRYPEGIKKHMEWINEGKLKYREHITNGFENMYKAFQELFTGANTGKAVVKA